MMNDLNIPFFRKTMFAGMATLFLSTGVTQANPVSAGEEVTEKHAVALSQQKKVTITGIVKDVLGPVVGANVVEKGTTNGTVTDMEGRFSLQVSSNAVLVVSYIGYIDQAIPVNGKNSFTVLLKEDSQALDEVVVVGYGTQKKVNDRCGRFCRYEQDGRQPSDHFTLCRTCRYGSWCFRNSR